MLVSKVWTKAMTTKDKGSTTKIHSSTMKKREATTCYYCGKQSEVQ